MRTSILVHQSMISAILCITLSLNMRGTKSRCYSHSLSFFPLWFQGQEAITGVPYGIRMLVFIPCRGDTFSPYLGPNGWLAERQSLSFRDRLTRDKNVCEGDCHPTAVIHMGNGSFQYRNVGFLTP